MIALLQAPAAAAQGLTAQEQEVDQLVLAGISQRKSGDYAGSIRSLQRAVSRARKAGYVAGEANAQQFLSLVYRLQGDYQRVLETRLAALAVFRRKGQEDSGALGAISAAYVWLKDSANAIRYAEQALELATRKRESDIWIGRQHQRLGIAFYLAHRYADAETQLRAAHASFQAFARLELGITGTPRAGIYTPELSTSRWLQLTLVALGRPEEALEIADQTRARVLSTRMSSGTPGEAAAASLRYAEMARLAVSRKVAFVEYTVEYRYDPDLLLEFSEFTAPVEAILIWVVRPDGSLRFRRVEVSGEPLDGLVAATIASIKDEARGLQWVQGAASAPTTTANSALATLSRMLIAPIRADLPESPAIPVVFVPQDALSMVPFAALESAPGRYLIEDLTPAVSSSIQTFTIAAGLQERSADRGGGVLVVGNPDMPALPSGERLPALPGAELEAQQVARLFEAHPVLGASATKDNVLARMASARIIHLATHGLLTPREGWPFNALALAPTQLDAGYLAVREIEPLRLKAELAVLSACDTGLGKLSDEGVLGFSRAFLAAGVPSVVASLWSVPDQQTAELMIRFYAELKRKQGKAHALRSAMLQILKTSRAPVQWAGFQLVGEIAASPTLASVRGDGAPARGRSAPQGYVTRLEVPAGIEHYLESPRSRPWGNDVDVTFNSALSLPELIAFYRGVCRKHGLREVPELAFIDEHLFSLVFRGDWTDRRLVVQGTDSKEPGGDRSLGLRFEPVTN